MDDIVDTTKIKAKVIPFKCPNCGGRGTVGYDKRTCHSCKGQGYITVAQEVEVDPNKI